MGSGKLTLEDHVNSIIAAGGPNGALKKSYMYDFLEDILDAIHTRGELPDLRAYHFKKVWGIWRLGKKRNYRLAREATGELLDTLMQKHGWNYEQVIENIRKVHFDKEKIKYGAKLQGMLYHVYDGSPSKAVMDYLKHQKDQEIRRKFRDLRPYHFGKCQQNLWIGKDGTKNYKLARQGMAEFHRVFKKRFGWDDKKFKRNLCRKHFYQIRIKYNARLIGMLRKVYGSAREAANDYFRHAA